jgi:hypothetical protein
MAELAWHERAKFDPRRKLGIHVPFPALGWAQGTSPEHGTAWGLVPISHLSETAGSWSVLLTGPLSPTTRTLSKKELNLSLPPCAEQLIICSTYVEKQA